MTKKLTRRQFLLRAAAGTGAALTTCCGLSALAMQNPAYPFPDTVSTGESTMNQKVLIAYASKCGSTAEIAQTIAEELTRRGYAADVRPAGKVTNLDGYSAVLVGSAVRYGQWLPEAVNLVEAQQSRLAGLPNAFFSVHMLNTGADEASTKARRAYIDPVRALVKPQDEVYFSGVIEMERLSLVERMLTRLIKGPQGDSRDWNAIRGWARTVLA